MFLETSQNSQKKTCARVSFLIKIMEPEACSFFKKEALAQVFSCEFFKILNNTFSYRTPLVAASAGLVCEEKYLLESSHLGKISFLILDQ